MTKPQGLTKTKITDWDWPTMKINSTVHGVINYLEWCEIEAERITMAGTPCRVAWSDRGKCAVVDLYFRDGSE